MVGVNKGLKKRIEEEEIMKGIIKEIEGYEKIKREKK